MVDPLDATRRKRVEGRFETLLKPLVTDGKVEDIDLSAVGRKGAAPSSLRFWTIRSSAS